MNIRDLEYLVALAETQHFGKAAKLCFVSQPTLSGQIKKLEEELGVTLFERTKRSVETTFLGKAIVKKAKLVLEQIDELQHIAQSHNDPLVGPLRMGAIQTLSPYLMPLILKPLRKEYPMMNLILSEELTDTLFERLDKHEIDAALVATSVSNKDFVSIPLFKEPFWFAHPKNHPCAEKNSILQSDLDVADILLLAEGHCLADQTMEVCHMQKRKMDSDLADLRAASLETLLQLVAAGFGCTFLPALALKSTSAKDKNLKLKKLELPNTYRQVSLVYRRSFPRVQALNAFIDIVLGNLPDTVQPADRR